MKELREKRIPCQQPTKSISPREDYRIPKGVKGQWKIKNNIQRATTQKTINSMRCNGIANMEKIFAYRTVDTFLLITK